MKTELTRRNIGVRGRKAARSAVAADRATYTVLGLVALALALAAAASVAGAVAAHGGLSLLLAGWMGGFALALALPFAVVRVVSAILAAVER